MSSSIPSLKKSRFLLDENVRVELDGFLISCKVDFTRLAPSTSDIVIAETSRREERVVVTNDEDFTGVFKGKVFAVVWLKIPQKDVNALITSFQKLLNECASFKAKLVILNINAWKAIPFPERKVLRFLKTK